MISFYTLGDSPLSIVFQFIDTKELVIQVSHCSKQFYRVKQQPNSWRYSSLRKLRQIGYLKHMPMLRKLDLSNIQLSSNNRIGDGGCRVLAENLKFVPQLNNLNLYNNDIGESGCSVLAENLKSVPQLDSLNLNYNVIGETGCRVLSENLLS